jgi:hypothetical protein
MDIVASCLSGLIVKIYDDTTENGIIQDGFLKECLHTLSCFLLAASSVGDFTYSVQLYAYNIVNHFANSEAFSELKEKSILYIYPVIILLSLPFIKRFSIPEVIVLIGSCILSFGEASTIKEDVSLRKLIMRLCLCVLIIFIVCFGLYFDVLSISLLKLCLFGLFYLLASCVYQSYELFFKHFQVDIKVDESFFKELMQYKASNKA